MASSSKSVFLIGPGFIGREVLDLLLAETYDVTALTRRKSYAEELAESGAKTVIGSLDDTELITKTSIANDIVIHTATADHIESVEAVIAGIEQRAKNNKTTIFIHTSGTSLLSDDAKGDYPSDKIFHDDKPEDIDALPDTASHRLIDLAIIRARQRLGEKAKLVIMLPPLIYGVNPKYKRLSIQLPTLTRFAIKHGYAGHVGKGASLWSDIHVFDLARAYMTLLHWLENEDFSSMALKNPYFFCENGQEHSWANAIKAVSKVLHDNGKIKSSETRTIPESDFGDLFGKYTAWVVGSNSRSRANRLRSMGWEAREKSLEQSLIEDETPLIMAEDSAHFSGYGGVAASGSG
jgi:nucleoside-diphosphate-sugar epimerase